MTNKQKEDQKEAIKRLQELLPVGSKVYCILRSVSRSGMSRKISLFIIKDNDVIYDITHNVGLAINYKIDRDSWALKVGGCGMDMGFHVVYSLGRTLFPSGFALPPGKIGRNGDKSGFDRDGGYALKHCWL